MTHAGHIRLGAVSDLRSYQLANPAQYQRALANQMKVSTAQGNAKYADKDAYDSWVMHNWPRGVGQETSSEGFLYAELDSRVPHQLTLPPLLRLTDGRDQTDAAVDIRRQPGDKTGVLTAGSGSTYDRVAFYVDAATGSPTYDLDRLWIYARIPPNTTVTVAIYAVDGSDKPTGAALASASISGDTDYQFRWYLASFSSYTLNAERCVVVYPANSANTVELAGGTSYTNAKTWTSADDGSTWTAHTTIFPFFLTDVHGLNTKASVTDIVRFNSQTYAAVGTRIYKYNTTNENWTAVGSARSTTITDLEVWESNLYIGLGDSTNLDTMNTSESYSSGSVQARLMHRSQGYLWRSDGENVYYTTDGSTWSSAIVVGPSDFSVRGFATAQNNVYVATDDGLWWIAPGDTPVGVTPFPGALTTNGKDMLAFEGNVYIPVDGHFYQFSELASLQNLWKSRPEELPASKLGDVVTCCATSNTLLIGVQPDSATGGPTVWAWNGEGWHFMAALPNGLTLTCLRYDRANSRVWCGTSIGLIFWFYVSDYLVNPIRDGSYTFQPYGWFETDWFSSEILEDEKDFDGVYVLARNITPNNPIAIYWQDDTSTADHELVTEDGNTLTTEGGLALSFSTTFWSLLGTLTGDRGEVRWPLSATARNTTEMRLGLLLSTTNDTVTPKVEAIRVKYHLMTTDWYVWVVPVLISGTGLTPQQLADGTVQDYTREQQRAHIRALETRVEPFLFEDIDDETYEVKVQSAQEVLLGEVKRTGSGQSTQSFDSVILLTLVQIAGGTYSG